MWAPKGQRPVAPVRPRYEWCYVYGFVRPATGETFWLLLPRVDTDWFGLALAEFAAAVGAGERKRVVLALDQAGWHVSPKVAVPDGLHPTLLPPYSPELQPAERLWPLINEPIANRTFRDLDELEAALAERCLALDRAPDLIRAHAHFHWWHEAPETPK